MDAMGYALARRARKAGTLLVATTASVMLLGAVCAAPAHATVSSIDVGDTTYYANMHPTFKDLPAGVAFDESSNTLTLDNAHIKSTGYNDAIAFQGSTDDVLTVNLIGNNTLTGCASNSLSDGLTAGPGQDLIFKGKGTLTVSGNDGISSGGKITIKSGTINARGFDNTGIEAGNGIAIKGGKVSASGKDWAMWTMLGKISNNYAHLGKIKGKLGPCATFTAGGKKWMVANDPNETYLVLVKSKKSGKSVKVNTQRFGGYTYKVGVIGPKAFSGSKMKSLTIGKNVETIGKQAFSKTKKLKTLNMRGFDRQFAHVNKKAFKDCGAKGGKKLTVHCGKSASYEKKQFKKFLVKHGMSKKVKVVK
ncbi:MAG: carbohydrate-binding domain-containing protein [Eggerthellaceae bacterium]|jgi:hypothetical protein